MFFARYRLRAAALAAAALFAAQVYAAQTADPQFKAEDYVKKTAVKKSPYASQASEEHRRRLIASSLRSNQIFSLLNGEIALQKGDAGLALATYLVMLNRTKSPEVAERALEMAVSLNAYEQAEMIYRKWREIEPVAGPAQRRMGWVRDLLMGNAERNMDELEDVLRHAGPEQTQRIFLILAQAAAQQPGLAGKAGKEVHKAANRYPEMPEAAVADVVYSAQQGNERHAVAALQRLAKLDTEILPPTVLTLRLVAQRKPEILTRFFEETDTANLSPVWQELEISSLVAANRQDKAYRRLQQLLSESPNADLYIQAALLSNSRKEDISVVSNYLEKAYNSGTREQKSRAAVIGAMRHADAKNYAQALAWVNKIDSPEYVFDKSVLKASIEAEQGRIHAALAEAGKAQKLTEQQGRFFGAEELQRVYLYALSQSNQPKRALSELNALAAAAAKQPDAAKRLPDIYYQRALVYEKMGRYDAALADLRRYLDLNPNSAAGMNALGYTLLTAPKPYHDLDTAFKLIQTAYHLEPESAAINDSMGWAYYLKGDAQAALPYLQYAFREYPDAEVGAHLGEVLWILGQRDEALKVWNEGLQRGGDAALLKATMRRLGAGSPALLNKPAPAPYSVK